MARLPRVVIVEVAHHVTQRGNGRQFILASDAERRVYLDLLRQAVHQQGVSVVGYCLMCGHTGRPLGSAEFVQKLEQGIERRLAPQKGGRPRKLVADKVQQLLTLNP